MPYLSLQINYHLQKVYPLSFTSNNVYSDINLCLLESFLVLLCFKDLLWQMDFLNIIEMGSKYLNFSLELLKGLSLGLLLSKIIFGYLSFGLFIGLLCFFRLWLRGLLFSRRSCRFWSCLGYQLLFLLRLRLSFL